MPRACTITLHTSITLLAELAEIIGRGKFVRPILRAGLSAAALVENYQRLAALVEPAQLTAPVQIRKMITCSPPRSVPMRS